MIAEHCDTNFYEQPDDRSMVIIRYDYGMRWYGAQRLLTEIHDAVESLTTESARVLALKQAASRRSVARARAALLAATDDPRNEVHLQDRAMPYARPISKRRVCAGSSRYRVMVT